MRDAKPLGYPLRIPSPPETLMRTTRTLSLRKEALAELTSDELSGVAGAQNAETYLCPASGLDCLTNVGICANISAALVDCPFGA